MQLSASATPRRASHVEAQQSRCYTAFDKQKCHGHTDSLTAENRRGMHGNAASILDLQMRRGQGLAAQTASRNAPVRQSHRRPLSDDADHTDGARARRSLA
jgi:hypothetical protein